MPPSLVSRPVSLSGTDDAYDPGMERELIPDAFRTTVKRLPGGTLVLTQFGDAGDQMLLIPDRYVKAVCEGLYHASLERDSE